MNDIEFGLLLNFIFWIVMLPAIVTFGVWVCVVLFNAMDKALEKTRAGSGRDADPHLWVLSKEAEERYRKAA
jgi:hypothetical protein